FECVYREFSNYVKADPTEHTTNLENYIKIASSLILKERETRCPLSRHPDLRPPSVLISDGFRIVRMIDWQHCLTVRLFSQAGVLKNFRDYDGD
ncbi:hypothetical protein AOQ84DRAFT_274959, partial [Glonium stellatum]